MNRNRNRIPPNNSYKSRRWKRAKDWVKMWIFENTSFERLNPEE